MIEVNFNSRGVAVFRHRLYADDYWRDGLPHTTLLFTTRPKK